MQFPGKLPATLLELDLNRLDFVVHPGDVQVEGAAVFQLSLCVDDHLGVGVPAAADGRIGVRVERLRVLICMTNEAAVDGQGQAFQAPADLGDGRRVRFFQGEIGIDGGGAADESGQGDQGAGDGGEDVARVAEEGWAGPGLWAAAAAGVGLAVALGAGEFVPLSDAGFGFVGYGMVVWHLKTSVCVCLPARCRRSDTLFRIAAGRWGNHPPKVGVVGVVGCGLWVVGCGFWVVGCGLEGGGLSFWCGLGYDVGARARHGRRGILPGQLSKGCVSN